MRQVDRTPNSAALISALRPEDDCVPAGWVVVPAAELERLLARVLKVTLAQTPPPVEFMTTTQVADLLGVSRRSIPTLIARDGLPVRRIGERTLRFERAEVLAWMRTRDGRGRARPRPLQDPSKKVSP